MPKPPIKYTIHIRCHPRTRFTSINSDGDPVIKTYLLDSRLRGNDKNFMKKIFSGVQPSGNLHIGNYLGAIKNWVKLQDEFESIFCVVDLHAITVSQDPEELRKKTIEIAKIYLACGIDPKKSTIFVQSQITEHAELCWILNTIARNGDLTKMTQFKDKTTLDFDYYTSDAYLEISEFDFYKNKSFKEGIKIFLPLLVKEFKEKFNSSGVGLFDYPVLMAADILLYDTDVVPVGEDQVQHVELARTLSRRFNQKFGETFIVPEPKLVKEGARIMGLDDPTKKMSKSAPSEYNYISLTDDAETIRKKIKKAVTDSGSEIVYSEDKPALHNLINIYALFSEKKPEEIVKDYTGKGYADFKTALAEVIIAGLKPIQDKMKALTDAEVIAILNDGAKKVSSLAKAKITAVKEKMGFIA